MKMPIHFKICISLGLSFCVGLWANFAVADLENKPEWYLLLQQSCQFVGTLFLNGLKMVVIPLIMTSIICGVAKIGGEKNFRRLGIKTFGFYALSGLLAVSTGLLCVNFIEPGIVDEEIIEQMLENQGSILQIH